MHVSLSPIVGPATIFPWGREQKVPASCHPRQLHLHSRRHTGTLYVGVTSNLYLRVMQPREGTWEGFTVAYGCQHLLHFEVIKTFAKPSLGKTTRRPAARKEAKPNSHHQS